MLESNIIVTHFHEIDQDKKYLLFLLITIDKKQEYARVQLCYRQSRSESFVNDRDYRSRVNLDVYLKEDRDLYNKLFNNQFKTSELIDLFDQKHPSIISYFRSKLSKPE